MTSFPASDRQRQRVLLAHRIADWHLTDGIHASRRRGVEVNRRYTEALAWLKEADLEDPGAQHQLATLQVSGAMDWAYSEPLPGGPWVETWPSELYEQAPRNLGEAGRLLLLLLDSEGGGEDRSPEEGPPGERESVSFSSGSDLLEQARSIYPEVAADEASGLGGLNFLVSTVLERSELSRRPPESVVGSVTLPRPEVLGVEQVARDDRMDLANRVRSGELVVEFVVGEPRRAAEDARRDDEGAEEGES